jgi:hypothetical protein
MILKVNTFVGLAGSTLPEIAHHKAGIFKVALSFSEK